MKKKFLSAFLLGAMTLAATSTFTSCKDYDDDITSLKEQIASLEDLVNAKEQTINSSIASLQSAITQANNDHATKAALEAAKNELQAAINKNYNDLVAKDAELSAAIAKAQAAADAAAAAAKENKTAIEKVAADLATANEKLGTLSKGLEEASKKIGELEAALAAQKTALETAIAEGDAATLQSAKDAVATLKTQLEAADKALEAKIAAEAAAVAKEIEGVKASIDELQVAHNNLAQDVVSIKAQLVTLENNLYAAIEKVDKKYDYVTKMLAKALRSLVFQPSLYVDGIEAIEYPYIDDISINELTPATMTRQHSYESVAVNLSNIVDMDVTTQSVNVVYGPAWGVKYHMNPSRSDVAYDNVIGWNEREVEVLTRVLPGKLGITSPELSDNGQPIFNNLNGTLTAALKIANPQLLAANGPASTNIGETGFESYGKDNIIALQVKSNVEGNDTVITSDYAMIYGEPVVPEAIIWAKANLRGATVDETCPITSATIHMYDTPQEALADEPALDLAWDDQKGIDLSTYVAAHYVRDCKTQAAKVPGTWAFGEEKAWGLHYEFETVEYKSSANTTIDSRYCVLDRETGNIQARNVEATADGGKTLGTQALASVGREPLVRVKLMQGTKTLLDGYILVRIVRATAEKADKEIVEYATELNWNHTFTGCNAYDSNWTTWDQFSDWVLTRNLDMTKAEFDAQYAIEGNGPMTLGTSDTQYYICNVYTAPKADAAISTVGTILYRADAENVNNHTFDLQFDESEIEAITHDTNLPVTKELWVRFIGTAAAKYANVWVKFDVVFDRDNLKTGIKSKIDNYWFALDGNDNGWDAVAYNVSFPEDYQNTTVWVSEPSTAFVNNKVQSIAATSGLKHFFVPVDTKITDHDGIEWTITAKSGKNDSKWNQLVCLYFNTNKHVWPLSNGATDNAKLGQIVKECAINYNAGVFTNTVLYTYNEATKNNTNYVAIATMDPVTGAIQLTRAQADYNLPLDKIVNAIGYKENHANISTEFHTWTGVVAKNGCDVVVDLYNTPGDNNTTYSIWNSSWQRPINFNNAEVKNAADAVSNGTYIRIFDLLSFYDWRGPVKGNMEGSNKWLWAYYNIYGVTIYLNPDDVTTDMNGGTLGVTKLSDITRQVHLYPATSIGNVDNVNLKKDFNVNLLSPIRYNYDSPVAVAGINAKASQYGYIYYENNGTNVTDFTVRIPLDIKYEWGHFSTYVDVKIDRTLGN